ncbi:MAG: L,D-transpeptidase [Actinomycetota bacterium]|nr:L,D-transpeptidase [Actinomycetota bacterium]
MAAPLAALLAGGCGGAGTPHTEAAFRYPTSGLVPVSLSLSTTDAASALASFASLAVAADINHRLPPGTSAVASALGRPVSVYRSFRDRRAERQFAPKDQYGITQVFLVKRATPGWLQVYLPVRPNDSTGWVRSSSVALTLDSYRVVVKAAAHELTTFHAGRALMHAIVGVGKPATPTPRGLFYVVEELRMIPSTGPYGTYAFGLSAHSTVLKTFGTGDAQVALHGTNEPASIGQNWSNGCVHMSDSVADWLARTLPLGTPVQIT